MRPFVKMHGLGNDFVVFDGRNDGFVPDADFCRAVADRHRGIGCDQITTLAKPNTDEVDIFMHMANADGSLVRGCGNASRCVGKLLFEETGKREGVIETISGQVHVWREGEDCVAVDFGAPRLGWEDIPLAAAHDTLRVPLQVEGLSNPCCVSMGNPHAVFFVADADSVPLDVWGPEIEKHPLFPDRTNVEVAELKTSDKIRMRVWERGTGITQACGTGAMATLVAAVRRGMSARRASILMDGGELVVTWRESDGHVIMEGTATLAFRGEWPD